MGDPNAGLAPVVSALVVDDRIEYARNVGEMLNEWGVSSDIASSVEEAARRLEAKNYTVVVCDNMLYDKPRGATFIAENMDKLSNSTVVLVTGASMAAIGNRDALEAKGVHIVSKQIDHDEKIRRIVKEAGKCRLQEARESIDDQERLLLGSDAGFSGAGPLPSNVVAHRLVTRARDFLVSYLRRLPDQHEKQIMLLGQDLTPAEAVTEVLAGSEVGEALVDGLLDDALGDDE